MIEPDPTAVAKTTYMRCASGRGFALGVVRGFARGCAAPLHLFLVSPAIVVILVSAVAGLAAFSAANGYGVGSEDDVLQITAVKKPLMAHAADAGWAENPSLLINRDFAFIAYDVSEGARSHIYLARVPRRDGTSDIKEILVSKGGEIEFGPSIASDGRDGIWVAWSSSRDGKWAIRAASVREMKTASEVAISDPGGFQSQARAATGDGVTCFVWVMWESGGYSILARTYDGKLGKTFKVYEGSDPVGRPDVNVQERNRFVFAWDQYSRGRFVIRMREMVGGELGGIKTCAGQPVESSGAADEGRVGGPAGDLARESEGQSQGGLDEESGDNWEPRISGRGANQLVSWHRVPQGSVKCEPGAAVPGKAVPGSVLEADPSDETWRVRCMEDADGNTWLAWTTRILYRSTNLFIRRVGPEGVGRACNIDFPIEKAFMAVFDCKLDGSLFVTWNRAGSIYLAEVTPRELPLSLSSLSISHESRRMPGPPPGAPDSSEVSGVEIGDAWMSSEDVESRAGRGQALGQDLAGKTREALGSGGAGQVEPESGRGSRVRYSTFYAGESLHVYFGDCHNHTSFSDGRAYPDISLLVARDRRRLDFAAITDHEVASLPGQFAWTNTVAAALSDEGHFACLHGEEVSKGWAKNGFGHWNMLFSTAVKMFHFEEGMTPPDLYAFAKSNDAILIPHHVAKKFAPHDWTYFDSAAEPVVEVCSLHGIFESVRGNEGKPDMVEGRFVEDGLSRGYVFGFVGGSDSHNCFEAAMTEYGLTGIYTESLTPQLVFEAMTKRRTYALTGGRIILDFRCNGRFMGEELTVGEMTGSEKPLTFTGYACSPDSIVSVEILSNRQVVYETQAGTPEVAIHWEVSIPDSQTYYYLRVATAKGDLAWSSPIWIIPQR